MKAFTEVLRPLYDRTKPLPSVRVYLICLVLACLVPALLGGAALLFHDYQVGRIQLQTDTLQTVRALVQTVDAKLAQAELLAQTLATSDTLARQDFPAFHRWAQTLLQESSIAHSILIYDARGQQRVNTNIPLGQPLPKRSHVAQVEHMFATGKTVPPEVLLSPLTGLPVVWLVVPVFSGTEVVFSLVIDDIAPQQLNSMLQQQKFLPEWVVAVVDSTDTIAARSISPEKFVGQKASVILLKNLQNAPEGIANSTTLDGTRVLSAYSRSPQSGWSVAIGIPSKSLEAELIHTLVLIGVGTLLLLGLALSLAWVVANRINTSVHALHTSAIALGSGELIDVPQVHVREVAVVAQAMASTAHLLKARTHALTVSNHSLKAHETELADAQRIAEIGSWTWNIQTDIVSASVELCRIFGRSKIPPFAQQDGVMFSHAAWLALHQAIQEVIQTGVGYNLELPALHGDGSHFWVNSRSEPVLDAGGSIIGLRGMVQDITERKQAESIATSERFIRAITDAIPGMVGYWDKDLRCRFANQPYLARWGKSAAAMMGTTLPEVMGESLFAINEPLIRAALAGEKQCFERFLTKPDGSVGHVLANYIPDLDTEGRVIGFITMITDIRALRLAESELKLAETVYQNTSEAIMVIDANGIILSVNPAFTDTTGYPAQETIGQSTHLLRSNHHEDEFYAELWRSMLDLGRWQGEIWSRKKTGEIYLAWHTLTKVAGSSGGSSRYVSVFYDITDGWRKNEHTRHLAFHDALTDLPNRSLLMERLERHISMSERDPRNLAILFLDLDHFKHVNDTLGHAVGDELLKVVAQKLQAQVRQSDTVARLGGDEFVIVLDNPASREEVVQIAKRIIAVIHEPFELRGRTAQVGTSIGIALYPEDGATAAELIKHADVAMYESKGTGRNKYRFFTPETTRTAIK
jgi:diguanylate cyclase (GGDEF)-like protein/PAS domain S-box-containing protein